MKQAGRSPRRSAGWRLLAEIGGLVLVLAVLLAASRGLSTVAPPLAGALRALAHPAVLVTVVGLGLLLRLWPRRPKPPPRSSRPADS
ncbi:MAG: hypothetical protein AB7I19_05355 [Planctomycetota bacterium]